MEYYKISEVAYTNALKQIENLKKLNLGEVPDAIVASLETSLKDAKLESARLVPTLSLPQPDLTGKEILTSKKMQSMFGANYQGLLYFNFDLCKWNTKDYLGYKLKPYEANEKELYLTKEILEADKRLQNQEIVAMATMLVDNMNYPGYAEIATSPTFNPNGNAVLGTIVLRDLLSKKILPVPVMTHWMGVERYRNPQVAKKSGMIEFADRAGGGHFKQILLNLRGKIK